MIDQDAPHEMRRHANEMRAILPAHLSGVDQPHERFVDERRRLQRVAAALAGHVAPRETTQFGVDERHQPLEGGLVAVAPRAQEQVTSGDGVARSLLGWWKRRPFY